jgi:HIT domain
LEEKHECYHPDREAIHHSFRTQPCFVCRMVEGNVRFPENIIYEDERALVFLDGYPRAYGYTLVAPKEHREQVTGRRTCRDVCSRWPSAQVFPLAPGSSSFGPPL